MDVKKLLLRQLVNSRYGLPTGKEILERKETIEFMKKFDINRFYPTPENLKLLDKIYNQKEEK